MVHRIHSRNTAAAGAQCSVGEATWTSKHGTSVGFRRPLWLKFHYNKRCDLEKVLKSRRFPPMRCMLGSFWNFLTVISVRGDREVGNRDYWAMYKTLKCQIGIISISNSKSYWHIHFFGFWPELYYLWLSEFLMAVTFISDLCRQKKWILLNKWSSFVYHIFQSIKPTGVKLHKGILLWKMLGQSRVEISKSHSNPKSSWLMLLLKLGN